MIPDEMKKILIAEDYEFVYPAEYGQDGRIICPDGLAIVLDMDDVSRSIAQAFRYREMLLKQSELERFVLDAIEDYQDVTQSKAEDLAEKYHLKNEG